MVSHQWMQSYEQTVSIHTAITLTKVVLPEYCRPTKVSSISSFQNRLFSQSRIRFTRANMSVHNVHNDPVVTTITTSCPLLEQPQYHTVMHSRCHSTQSNKLSYSLYTPHSTLVL